RAGIIEAYYDISERSDVPVKERAAASPAVSHGLACWFTVDLHQHRVLLCRIKVSRLDHPSIYRYTVTGIGFEVLRRLREELPDLLLVFGAVAACSNQLVVRQRHQLAHPRIIDTGEDVKGVLPIRR